MFYFTRESGMIHNAELTGIGSLSIALNLATEALNIET
jgi:hypothetical protein